jgi:hypothetical protein
LLPSDTVTTLVINAPRRTVLSDRRKTFDLTFSSGVGDGYAISRASAAHCHVGCKVVLLSTDEYKRAEGILVKLEPAGKAGNGLQRYDAHIESLRRVAYRPGRINRNGVAVIVDRDE